MKALATTVRIDPQLKNAANAVFEELGISLSAGVSAFLKAVVREKGMPFEMKLDADIMPNLKSPKTIEMVVSNKISGNIDLNRAPIL